MKEYSNQLDELKKQRPEVVTFRDLWEKAKKRGTDINMRPDLLSQGGGVSAAVTGFAGGMGGYASSAVTGNDPTIYLMGMGGIGKSAATRIATEAGVQGGIEAVNQFTGVALNKKLLGIENTTEDKIRNILTVAAFGATMRAGGEYLPSTFRNIEARISPERAFARAFRDEVERTNIGQSFPINDFLDTRKRIERGIDGKNIDEKVAAVNAENSLDFLEGMRLYGQGINAEAYARNLLQKGIDIIEGRPVTMAADVRASVLDDRVDFDIPDFDAAKSREIYTAAREESPQTFLGLDNAQREYNALNDAIRNKTRELNNFTVGDLIADFDRETGLRINQIQDELDGAITKGRRVQLERELDMVMSGIKDSEIQRALDMRTERLSGEIDALHKQRKQVKTNLNKQAKAATSVVDNIQKREKARQSLQPSVKVKSRYGYVPKKGERVSYMTRSEIVKSIDDSIEFAEKNTAEKVSSKIVDRVKQQAGTDAKEIDFGSFKISREDDMFIVESNADGTYRTGRIDEILREFDEEDALIKSMKECGI
jgi:hypothetical protein